MLTCSRIDRHPIFTQKAQCLLIQIDRYRYGLDLHREIAAAHGVPFAVSEWSNNGDPKDVGKGGEAPEYVRLMNAWFRQHAGDPKHPAPGKLLYEIHFNLQDQFEFLPTQFQPETAKAYRTLVWGR